MADREQKEKRLKEILDILEKDGDIKTTYYEGKFEIEIVDIRDSIICKWLDNDYVIRYYENPSQVTEMLNLLLQLDYTMLWDGSLHGYFNNLPCVCYFASKNLTENFLITG